jgi:hypothetical protein
MSATIQDKPSKDWQEQLPFEDFERDILGNYWVTFLWENDHSIEFSYPLTAGGGLLSSSFFRRAPTREFPTAKARFVTTASLTVEETISLLENIVLTPEEGLLVQALQIIDPSIERFAPVGGERPSERGGRVPASVGQKGGVYIKRSGTKPRLPIGTMGDGIWRMLGLAAALVGAEGGILLVDEIDTGLHYSVMERMWLLVTQAAKRLGVQVFATTHSRDCFESLASVVANPNHEPNSISIQRIDKDRKRSVAYSEDEIVAAAAREIEVR